MAESKYKGIDERVTKCCDPSETHHEAGISFDTNEAIGGGIQHSLRFHFLEQVGGPSPVLLQTFKSMWLNKENTQQLIKELQSIEF